MRKLTMSGWPSQQSPEVKFLKRLTTAIATWYLPRAIDAVGKKAVRGDLAAAKLLFAITRPPAPNLQATTPGTTAAPDAPGAPPELMVVLRKYPGWRETKEEAQNCGSGD